jgi:hypothetical protein
VKHCRRRFPQVPVRLHNHGLYVRSANKFGCTKCGLNFAIYLYFQFNFILCLIYYVHTQAHTSKSKMGSRSNVGIEINGRHSGRELKQQCLLESDGS